MGRDHFKKIMFTPNFVKDTRDDQGHYVIERKIESIFKKILTLFKKVFYGK